MSHLFYKPVMIFLVVLGVEKSYKVNKTLKIFENFQSTAIFLDTIKFRTLSNSDHVTPI